MSQIEGYPSLGEALVAWANNGTTIPTTWVREAPADLWDGSAENIDAELEEFLADQSRAYPAWMLVDRDFSSDELDGLE